MTKNTTTDARPRLQVGVCLIRSDDDAEVVAEETFDPGVDLRLGDETGALTVPGWTGLSFLLISGDGFLHLQPGMRVNMCGDQGAGRIVGTYEELLANGVTFPIPIKMRRVNIRVREGVSIFAKYVDDDGNIVSSEVEACSTSP